MQDNFEDLFISFPSIPSSTQPPTDVSPTLTPDNWERGSIRGTISALEGNNRPPPLILPSVSSPRTSRSTQSKSVGSNKGTGQIIKPTKQLWLYCIAGPNILMKTIFAQQITDFFHFWSLQVYVEGYSDTIWTVLNSFFKKSSHTKNIKWNFLGWKKSDMRVLLLFLSIF